MDLKFDLFKLHVPEEDKDPNNIKIDTYTLSKNTLKITKKTPHFEFYRVNKNIEEWRVPWRSYLNFVEVVQNEK